MMGAVKGQKMPYAHNKSKIPEKLKDFPAYLKSQTGGFFSRFAYIVKLVWDTGHWILFLLTFVALFKGVTPVIGSLISKSVLNKLQSAVSNGVLPESEFWQSPLFFSYSAAFCIPYFAAGGKQHQPCVKPHCRGKVVKQVKLQIMEKAKNLDLASFDNPAFYEKMENASREAGSRPLGILSETFNIISTIIEFASFLLILFTAPGLAGATLVIIAVSIPSAVINFIYRKKNFNYMRRRSKERRQMDYYSGLLVDKDMKEKQTVVPAVQQPLQVKQNTGHTIQFVDVSFRYPGTQKDVLHKINLTIDAGQTVAIAGTNGAGKTTFIRLLTRLCDHTEGKIANEEKMSA